MPATSTRQREQRRTRTGAMRRRRVNQGTQTTPAPRRCPPMPPIDDARREFSPPRPPLSSAGAARFHAFAVDFPPSFRACCCHDAIDAIIFTMPFSPPLPRRRRRYFSDTFIIDDAFREISSRYAAAEQIFISFSHCFHAIIFISFSYSFSTLIYVITLRREPCLY